MKKTILAASIMIITMSLIGCNKSEIPSNENLSNQTTNENTNNNHNSNEIAKISIEEAKNIALKHANLTSDKVSFINVESDLDNEVEKYDIEFYYENTEYDYEINAITGEIIEYDYDVENYNINKNQANNENINNNQALNETIKISTEQAKEIALKHANLTTTEVTFGKVELDFDDGIQKYDIKFYNNKIQYDYEIDANTGEIISYEKE